MTFASDLSTAELGLRPDSCSCSDDTVQGNSTQDLRDFTTAPESSASVAGEACSKVDSCKLSSKQLHKCSNLLIPTDTAAEAPYNDCRFRDGRNKNSLHHGGVAELAGMFDWWPNWKFYRGFGWENWHLLLDSQYRIIYLSDQLRDYYKQHPEKARGPTANHKRPAGQPPVADELETIKAELRKEMDDYYKQRAYVNANEQHHEMHPEQWKIIDDWMTNSKNLDPEAGIILRSPEDLIGLAEPPPHWIIQVSADISRRYHQWFKPACKSKHEYIPMAMLTIIFKTITSIAAVLLLLVPAGLLYLAPLDKGQVFAIIGVSTVIFCATVSAKTRLDTTTTALAGCAYLAFCGAFAVATGNIPF
ncbi:hypothetical protein QBC41DRAFT_325053 [Cercophora samala]|uniref:DUF6594 domain-containing protein n=1 Tax=Cercophora samala TaxID=330535 RepID=A0AA39Z9Q3_9PEZI|nr:hypothetical protein QBC41DRAFT_325053 [Cercophora samala]